MTRFQIGSIKKYIIAASLLCFASIELRAQFTSTDSAATPRAVVHGGGALALDNGRQGALTTGANGLSKSYQVGLGYAYGSGSFNVDYKDDSILGGESSEIDINYSSPLLFALFPIGRLEGASTLSGLGITTSMESISMSSDTDAFDSESTDKRSNFKLFGHLGFNKFFTGFDFALSKRNSESSSTYSTSFDSGSGPVAVTGKSEDESSHDINFFSLYVGTKIDRMKFVLGYTPSTFVTYQEKDVSSSTSSPESTESENTRTDGIQETVILAGSYKFPEAKSVITSSLTREVSYNQKYTDEVSGAEEERHYDGSTIFSLGYEARAASIYWRTGYQRITSLDSSSNVLGLGGDFLVSKFTFSTDFTYYMSETEDDTSTLRTNIFFITLAAKMLI